MKKLVFLLCLLPSGTFAQQYFRLTADLSDSTNATLVQTSELLSVLLLDGYLDGDLRAYKFDVKSEDVKWKPIPEDLVPDAWDPQLDYYQQDRVAYQGKYYEVVYDEVGHGTPPPAKEWWPLDLHGDVVSTVHSFPEARDSTTKAYFLENFARFEEYSGSQWYEDIEYYMNDVVWYKGLYYECNIDHATNKQPGIETDYWKPVGQRVQFYLPGELRRISVLYVRGDNASLIPQMLTLSYLRFSTESWESPGLNFYYQDVVDYLARQRQLPLLFQSPLGYVGAPQLVPGVNNVYRVVELVREGLRNGDLKPSKKDIADAARYDQFIKEKTWDPQNNWWAIQDLITNDVWLSLFQSSDATSEHAPFLRVPWKSMEGIVKAREPTSRLWNYAEILERNAFNTWTDTLDIDTLEARPYKPVAGAPISRMYFTERRAAPIQTNPALSQAMKSLWPLLQEALNKGTITAQPLYTRLFRCDQPFPAITIDHGEHEWIFPQGFTLGTEDSVAVDSAIVAASPVNGIGVLYKRYVTSQKSKAPLFEPVKLSVMFYSPVSASNVEYCFMWEDVVKVTSGRKDLEELLEVVRTGKLKFDYSELVYGLIGER